LQSGTSHNLGQNFAKAFEIRYLDKGGRASALLDYFLGPFHAIYWRFIMVGMATIQGLILPPRLAPFQIVIVADLQGGRGKIERPGKCPEAASRAGRCRYPGKDGRARRYEPRFQV